MWYEIERNLNSFIISNTGSKDLYLTLFLSEKCDIDVNYKVCIEEVIIRVGDSYTFNLPIKDGLYKLLLTDKEGNYQELFIPQYLELLSSLVEDINYVLCGCNCKDCDDCDNCDGDAEILSVLLKILSYISINKNKYEKALASSNACVECDILESNLCTLINENISENKSGDLNSQLKQWPIQLHLISPAAPYYEESDLLLAADCTAFAMGDFHTNYLKGKSVAIACPKLDSDQDVYVKKVRQLIDHAKVKSITVLVMEVPCCMGLVQTVREALSQSELKPPVKIKIVGLKGNIKDEIML